VKVVSTREDVASAKKRLEDCVTAKEHKHTNRTKERPSSAAQCFTVDDPTATHPAISAKVKIDGVWDASSE